MLWFVFLCWGFVLGGGWKGRSIVVSYEQTTELDLYRHLIQFYIALVYFAVVIMASKPEFTTVSDCCGA